MTLHAGPFCLDAMQLQPKGRAAQLCSEARQPCAEADGHMSADMSAGRGAHPHAAASLPQARLMTLLKPTLCAINLTWSSGVLGPAALLQGCQPWAAAGARPNAGYASHLHAGGPPAAGPLSRFAPPGTSPCPARHQAPESAHRCMVGTCPSLACGELPPSTSQCDARHESLRMPSRRLPGCVPTQNCQLSCGTTVACDKRSGPRCTAKPSRWSAVHTAGDIAA